MLNFTDYKLLNIIFIMYQIVWYLPFTFLLRNDHLVDRCILNAEVGNKNDGGLIQNSDRPEVNNSV